MINNHGRSTIPEPRPFKHQQPPHGEPDSNKPHDLNVNLPTPTARHASNGPGQPGDPFEGFGVHGLSSPSSSDGAGEADNGDGDDVQSTRVGNLGVDIGRTMSTKEYSGRAWGCHKVRKDVKDVDAKAEKGPQNVEADAQVETKQKKEEGQVVDRRARVEDADEGDAGGHVDRKVNVEVLDMVQTGEPV